MSAPAGVGGALQSVRMRRTRCVESDARRARTRKSTLGRALAQSPCVPHRSCLHCGDVLLAEQNEFCCEGCRFARALIDDAGLGRFYELRGDGGTAPAPHTAAAEAWREALSRALLASTAPTARVDLDVQGIRCAACVWLLEKLFRRLPGALSIEVNPGLGKLVLQIEPRTFPLDHYLRDARAVGYPIGPSAKPEEDAGARRLLARIGVCAAISVHVMMFSLAVYAGLADGALFRVMRVASLLLTAIVVVVGGAPFFRGALEAARRKSLHLDVPIALGIALAFAGSVAAELLHTGRDAYFDTVSVFVTLMLFGRLLQERILDRNRRALLADDGIGSVSCRILDGDTVRVGRVAEITLGTRLLVRPGELVPVSARLDSEGTEINREWLTGESQRSFAARGDSIEGGSFVEGRRAVIVVAEEAPATSRLASLLRAPTRDEIVDGARRTPFWSLLARAYVVGTIAAATAAGAVWWVIDRARALDVVVALLVVACPCAFGIAVPIAYEVVQARLRRASVFVRSSSLLDRLPRVRKLVFDKTGTLTLGELEITNRSALLSLDASTRALLLDMVLRSNHPKSVAVAAALAGDRAAIEEASDVEEIAGRGLIRMCGGHEHRLGAPDWTGVPDAEGDVVLARDGRVVCALRTRERLRDDAAPGMAALGRDGYALYLSSGDAPERVASAARRLGIAAERCRAAATPEDKRAYIEELDRRDTLMIGDGVNDAAAMAIAFASATPAGDLPFLPARTDVLVQGRLCDGLRVLLAEARRLERVVRQTVLLGVTYNALAVSAAALGLMSPLLAAVLMPASSLGVVSLTLFRLRHAAPLGAATRRPSLPPSAPRALPWKSSSSSSS